MASSLSGICRAHWNNSIEVHYEFARWAGPPLLTVCSCMAKRISAACCRCLCQRNLALRSGDCSAWASCGQCLPCLFRCAYHRPSRCQFSQSCALELPPLAACSCLRSCWTAFTALTAALPVALFSNCCCRASAAAAACARASLSAGVSSGSLQGVHCQAQFDGHSEAACRVHSGFSDLAQL